LTNKSQYAIFGLIDNESCVMADDLRTRRLRAFDAHSREFLAYAGPTLELGEHLARADIDRLAALADQVVRSLVLWRDRLAAVEVAVRQPLSVPLAARLVTETVFDDLLEPEATRVLAAAIDLAL
jgi:hypothetical protein